MPNNVDSVIANEALQQTSAPPCSPRLFIYFSAPLQLATKRLVIKDIMQRRLIIEREKNEKHLKNLLDHTLYDHQLNLLAKGLKFIATPVTNENKIRQQLLRDFEQFARRMRPHNVRSNWIPPVQPCIGGFMLTSLFTFLLIRIRLCTQKKT